MGTSAGCGSPRDIQRRNSEPARQISPAMPSRLRPTLALQQAEVLGQGLVEVVVLLEEGAVRLAVAEGDERALLGHVLGELGLRGRLLTRALELPDDVGRRALR